VYEYSRKLGELGLLYGKVEQVELCDVHEIQSL